MNPKVAVVGAGYWGKNLIRNFHELGYLHTICDSNSILEQAYSVSYPSVNYVIDFEEVLSNESLDAVVLSTPVTNHYPMAKKALSCGKHVYVEKPLALDVQDALELVNIAEQNNRVLMVGHILQYHSSVLKLKELLDAGDLGKIRYIYSNRLNMGKIRTEENILWSFAPHDISVILMFLNEMPQEIITSGGDYLQEGISDITVTLMKFSSGVNAHIFVSWLHPFKEQKLVVVGEKKMAVFNDTADDKLLLYPHKVEWKKRIPVASKAEAEIVPVKLTEPLKSECRHFIDCIKTGQKPRTDGYEGLQVLKILNASQKSLNQNGRTIKLDENGDLQHLKPSESNKSSDISIHESSYVDEKCWIGNGTKIWHFSHLLKGSKIGKNCRIGQNVVIGPNATVGNHCKIQNNVSIFEGVTLEDYVFCGPSMVFTNVYNPRSEIPRMNELRPTLVKKGATLGANCTIVCGHTIGAYAFIGAGAVITGSVPDYALMAGNPARRKGWMCACGHRIKFNGPEAVCRECGNKYRKRDENSIRIMRKKSHHESSAAGYKNPLPIN